MSEPKYTRTDDNRETKTVDGDDVHVTASDTRTFSGDYDSRKERFDNHVLDLINGVQAEREARENLRANRRNFNRTLTLVMTIIIGLTITYLLTSGTLGHFGKVAGPYAFVITVTMDLLVTGYAYIRHY
jgi:hypothetical protein